LAETGASGASQATGVRETTGAEESQASAGGATDTVRLITCDRPHNRGWSATSRAVRRRAATGPRFGHRLEQLRPGDILVDGEDVPPDMRGSFRIARAATAVYSLLVRRRIRIELMRRDQA